MKYIFLALFLFGSAQGASYNLTGQFGSFSSEGFPARYGNNVNDSWLITVKHGFRIVVYFAEFELEDSIDQVPCSQDYLEIIDGAEGNRTKRLCGNPRMFRDDSPALFTEKFRSSGSKMLLRMISDYSNNLTGSSRDSEPLIGFKAHFFKEDINECQEMRSEAILKEVGGRCDHFCNNYPGGFYCSCRRGYKLHDNGLTCVGDCFDKTVTDSAGTISSPGYPVSYPSLTKCKWTIKTLPGEIVVLNFNRVFGIEDHHNAPCPYDYLKINDSSGQIGSLYCGTLPPFNGSDIRSKTNWLEIHFYSDASFSMKGFQFTYKSSPIVCQVPPQPDHGRIFGVASDGSDRIVNQFITFSSLIRFECDEGFRLEGSGKVACLKDGTFSDYPPVCVPF